MHVPPRPKKLPSERLFHGDKFIDDYAWLRDKANSEVIEHLQAENSYTADMMAHTVELQNKLFQEIKGRVLETDLSVPLRFGPWWYFGRTTEGEQYRLHCRVPAEGGMLRISDVPPKIEAGVRALDEEILLDENLLAGDSEYFALGAFELSIDHRFLAYATDHDGSERYTLRVRDLATGVDLDDVIPEVTYGVAWSDAADYLFYVKADEAERPYQLWRHRIGTGSDVDECVYTEEDEHFFLSIERSKDDCYLVMHLGSKTTDEAWILPADDPTASFEVVQPREAGVEYSVEHQGDRFLILTNADGAENFKLMTTPDDEPGRRFWSELIPHDPEVKLTALEPFSHHLVLHERRDGLSALRVLGLDNGADYYLEQPEQVSTVYAGGNAEYDTTVLRYGYTSLVTPSSIFDVDLGSGQRELRKQQPVLGNYNAADYVTQRLWALADDGTEIPISVVARADRDLSEAGPVLLYGYGSYEIPIDPSFSSARLSLLDRGFVFAIAHIRGGGEMGRRWYLEGKELNKRNTFTDFVACAKHLINLGMTDPAHLAIRGGSAGGLLMGAVLNLAPELFGAVVAEVPFVDALNTILDPSLPLTVTEWEEWGNPLADAEVYEYMKSYSPYENVVDARLPAVLVTAGLNDPRVSYWEPAKWVAKLREHNQGGGRILLKTEMGAGHQGPSGRYDAWRDEALVFAFLIDTVGTSEVASTT